MWYLFQAWSTLCRVGPFGKIASGWVRMSWVGVNANFASSRSGPRHQIDEQHEQRRSACVRHVYLTGRRRQSELESAPRSG